MQIVGFERKANFAMEATSNIKLFISRDFTVLNRGSINQDFIFVIEAICFDSKSQIHFFPPIIELTLATIAKTEKIHLIFSFVLLVKYNPFLINHHYLFVLVSTAKIQMHFLDQVLWQFFACL